MNISNASQLLTNPFRKAHRTVTSSCGNVLVYLVVVILIFGVLGVAMVSLFSTAGTSSATPNDAKRADYMQESGVRYAFSQLRNSGFTTSVINELNTTDYSVSPSGGFSLNVFGPWFESSSNQDLPSGGGNLALTAPAAREIPEAYLSPPNPNLWIVNFDYIGDLLSVSTLTDQIDSWSKTGPDPSTTLTIDTSGDFVVNTNERVCFSVQPTISQSINPGGNLYVQRFPEGVFPHQWGAINIGRIDYVYERLVDEPANNRVVLENISAASIPNKEDPFPTPRREVDNTDFIILSPRNFFVIPTGTSDQVTLEGTTSDASYIFDSTTGEALSRPPDIADLPDNINPVETVPNLFVPNPGTDTLNIGPGGGQEKFGGAWYDASKNIGGVQNFCNAGRCQFGLGVRAFFMLEYVGDGPGLTFTLLNGTSNTIASSGGDIQLSELLGYAGDSRTQADGSTYLATSPEDRGLDPPKIAMEFDTRTNNANFAYCADAITVNPNTRNDPLINNRDAVQYVFWGFNALTISCRDNNPTYDDNRHEPGEGEVNWTFPTSSSVRSTPAVADDGTIYVGSDDGHLYAVNPDGSEKWRFPSFGSIGAVRSSPIIADDGTIYVGSQDGHLYAINPDGSSKWTYPVAGSIGPVRSSPNIGSDGTVYVGSDDGRVYAVNPLTGALLWAFNTTGAITPGRPAIDLNRNDKIYVANSLARLYALDPADRQRHFTLGDRPFPTANEWTFNLVSVSDYAPGIDTTGGPNDGTIYTDSSGGFLRALNPDGTTKWAINVGSDIDSTPVVGEGGTIYFGTDGGALFALEPVNGNVIWQFPTAGEVDNTAAIATDGTILFVSNDGNLYAVRPNGTEKWRFAIPVTPGWPNSSPAVGADGAVYVGSAYDNNLYSINRVANPQNIKDNLVTSVNDGSDVRVGGEIVTVDSEDNWLQGSSSKGPYAIRLEVMRSLTANANGNYDYVLHAWVRQCNEFDCNDVLGTYFEDTRIEYNTVADRAVHLEQAFELPETEHLNFNQFLFGFTAAVGAGDTQTAAIKNFRLSFIRFNDPVVGSDPDWPPP
jgi:outer membrane protein assembly factor BamB